MKPNIEKIKEYLKKVESSKNKFTIAEYFKYVNERFDISTPPKYEMLKACRDIGMSIYLNNTEIDYTVKDKDGCLKNIYPEHILAKEFFKELFYQ